MPIWTEWWSWVEPLRAACSRSRSFLWLLAALAGISVRNDLLGVTSIVRALGLGAQCYDMIGCSTSSTPRRSIPMPYADAG